MAKLNWKPTTLLNPVPTVMVTCADAAGKPNIITLAWAGTVNSEPPMLSISVRKSRYSHALILDRGEFVVNLANVATARAADLCGVKSGRDTDKWTLTGLTPEPAKSVNVPLIKECPINLECKVSQVIELPSHDMIIGDIVAVDVDEGLLNAEGKLDIGKADLICYSHGDYWSLDKIIGFFGYSVASEEVLKRRMKK